MSKSRLLILILIFFYDFAFSQCDAKFSFSFFTETKVKFITNADSLRYSWSFGDGIGTDFQNPIHFFNRLGPYTVCLKVTDKKKNCTDSFCTDINIGGNSCSVDFDYKVLGKDSVQLKIISPKKNVLYTWNLNNEKSIVDTSINYKFSLLAPDSVCVSSFDSTSGCSANICKVINPKIPVAPPIKKSSLFSPIGSYIYFDEVLNRYVIRLKHPFSERLNIYLCNSIGEILQTKTFQSPEELYFDYFKMAKGIYFYMLDYKGFLLSTGKFMN